MILVEQQRCAHNWKQRYKYSDMLSWSDCLLINRTLHNYLLWHVVSSLTSYLSKPFRNAKKILTEALSGKTKVHINATDIHCCPKLCSFELTKSKDLPHNIFLSEPISKFLAQRFLVWGVFKQQDIKVVWGYKKW